VRDNADHQAALAPRLVELAMLFPLVPRGRPAAQSLPVRIDEVRRLAAEPTSAVYDRLAHVAQALNKAALIASDSGLPDLARELCWRQFTVMHAAAPLLATTAQYALEPIINLGRLAARRGDGVAAYQLYQDTFDAITTGTSASIDGRDVDFGNLVQQPEGLPQLRQFLRAVLLADGTRALTTAGRWNHVLAHVQRYNGIGNRMLDGRQAAVLAHAMCGRTEQALTMVDVTATPEPWEPAVAACLRTLCLRLAGRTNDDAVAAMIDAFRALPPKPQAVVFHTRLGLCTAALAKAAHPAASEEITTNLVQFAVQAGDAHAADLLARHMSHAHTTPGRQSLTSIIEASGLNQYGMPLELLNPLTSAAELALTTLANLLVDLAVEPRS
jgi:hypothetical protein